MQQHAAKDKVGKGALMRDAGEFGLVLRVGLDAERGGEDELADGCAEAGEEGVEGLGLRLAIVQSRHFVYIDENPPESHFMEYSRHWSLRGDCRAVGNGGSRIRTKLPTIMQYRNCSAPTKTKNAMNVSSSLTRCGVLET